MRKNVPYMVLDITKKPGDPNAVKTGDALLAENTKLREAVIKTQSVIAKCMDILNKIPECGYNGLIDDVADELCDLREEYVKAALAAPPRNCDRYLHDEALQVWASEKKNEHNGCFDEWLYEIAKEGGNK